MRRSAAPSYRAAKRAKFTTPFLASKANTQDNGTAESALKTNDLSKLFTGVKHEDLKTEKLGTFPKVAYNQTSWKATTLLENRGKTCNINPMAGPMADETRESLCKLQVIETTSPENVVEKTEEENSARNMLQSPGSSSVKKGKENYSYKSECVQVNSTAFKPPTMVNKSSSYKCANTSRGCETKGINQEEDLVEHYYSVVWCKMSKKKHKTWDGDGVLKTKGRTAVLQDIEGKDVSRGCGYKKTELETLQEGQTLCVGGKELEIMGHISCEDYLSGKCFQQSSVVKTPEKPQTNLKAKPFKKPQRMSFQGSKMTATNEVKTTIINPRHRVDVPGALVMPRPSASHQWENNKKGSQIVDVVADPYLSQHLRPHQRQGVVFLYECVMGMRNFVGNGAILADDMGLGKTLQCIMLTWILHKQGAYGGTPVSKRTLIITPGSLVKNWCAEFRKWLGTERMRVYAVNSEQKAEEFKNSPLYPVMVISYEMFIRAYEDISNIKFDLLICDEAHRLKNSNIKTNTLISSLKISRRVLLTGTPVQNDLQEFHSLVELCNPGVLGSQSAFRKIYEDPIVHGQQPNSSSTVKLLGQSRAAELNRLTSLFFLRRTADVNNEFLPPKVENVVFCRPSNLQLKLYHHLLSSRVIRSCTSSSYSGSYHLVCIGALKKLCNDPSLLYNCAVDKEEIAQDIDGDVIDSLFDGVKDLYPEDFDPTKYHADYSGKMRVLCELLETLRRDNPKERVILVSNYTQTLDVLQKMCEGKSYGFCRLDGQTPTSKRQAIVDSFNKKYGDEFVFLLSSKAGGVGLNLIGASRLVLYDIDWNPANDLQAMARVWRDGQKRKVFVYRLITTGTIEEKIYQRQISKQGLSGAIMDTMNSSKVEFSKETLKDLFTLEENTCCVTHDLLQCACAVHDNEGENNPSTSSSAGNSLQRSCQLGLTNTTKSSVTKPHLSMAQLMDWKHYAAPLENTQLQDEALKSCSEQITFVFECETNTISHNSTLSR